MIGFTALAGRTGLETLLGAFGPFATGHTSCRLAAIQCLVPLAGLAGGNYTFDPIRCTSVHQQIRPGRVYPCPEPPPDDIRDPPNTKVQ